MKTKLIKCPDCFGDGIETCHNPDHGFLTGVLSIKGVNESACPCCGHSEDHKMRTWNMKTGKYDDNQCDTCSGSGKVTKIQYNAYLSEYVALEDLEEINNICLDNNPK